MEASAEVQVLWKLTASLFAAVIAVPCIYRPTQPPPLTRMRCRYVWISSWLASRPTVLIKSPSGTKGMGTGHSLISSQPKLQGSSAAERQANGGGRVSGAEERERAGPR